MSVFNMLPDSCKTPLEYSDFQQAKSAGGACLDIRGKTVGNTFYFQSMYVVNDLIVDMILGQDFLKENEASIDSARNQLKIKKSCGKSFRKN